MIRLEAEARTTLPLVIVLAEAFPRGLDCAELGQPTFETRELARGLP